MVKKEDLIISKHAGDKMLIEGISEEQICRVLERGSKFTQTEGYLAVHTYFSVAYKMIGKKYKIKTVYLNR